MRVSPERTLSAVVVLRREGYRWTNLGEGDVNWCQVKAALQEINFNGFLTAELAAGDEPYLADVAGRMDRLLIK